MIISHQREFIFFAAPKTATHAIRHAIYQQLDGEEYWEQQRLFFPASKLPIAGLANLKTGHITALQARRFLAVDIWNNFTKFGFVRNPYDRFISACFFLNRQNPRFLENITQNLIDKAIALKKNQINHFMFNSQASFFTDNKGKVLVEWIAKYEYLPDAYYQISESIGLSYVELVYKNTSQHNHFSQYYNQVLRYLIRDIYRQDFELFNYSTDMPIET